MAIIFTENYSGEYGYLYELKLEATESDVSASNNTSKVTTNEYLRRINVSANGAYNLNGTPWSIGIDGTTYSDNSTWDTRNTSAWQLIGTATKTITHDADGSKTITISGTHTGNSASGSSKMGNASGSGTFKLTDIPRDFSSPPKLEIVSKSLTSVTIKWTTSENADRSQYKVDNGSWVDVETNINKKTGTMTINGLIPNTNYTIYGDFRRKDSGVWSQTKPSILVTTYDIARLTSYPNFNLGDSVTVRYTNPSSATIQVGLYIDENTELASYRNCSGSSYTFNFTDEELDRIYKAMNGNTLTARFYINTSNNAYREYKEITIILTGNQKTGHVKINGNWKRSKHWIKINGVWKRSIRWINVNGTWKRCI